MEVYNEDGRIEKLKDILDQLGLWDLIINHLNNLSPRIIRFKNRTNADRVKSQQVT